MNNKALSRLIFAAGDYVALVFAAYMALKIRNMIMTYSVYHVNTEYILFWTPLVFMSFILYSGLYTKRMLTYKMTEELFLCFFIWNRVFYHSHVYCSCGRRNIKAFCNFFCIIQFFVSLFHPFFDK